MSWYAAAGMAAGQIAGGLLSAAYNYRAERKTQAREMDWNSRLIRTRVADANAAGIHPLYALGANVQGATFSHMPTDSIASGVNAAASTLAAYSDAKDQRELLRAQIDSINLQNKQRELEIEAFNSPKAPAAPAASSSPFLAAASSKSVAAPKTEYDGFQGVNKKYEDYYTRYAADEQSGDWFPDQNLIDLISEDFFSAIPYHNRKMNKLHHGNFEFWHEKAERETSRLHRENLLPRNYIVVADYDLASHGGFYPRLMKISHPNDYRNIPYLKYLRSGSYRFFNRLGYSIAYPFLD